MTIGLGAPASLDELERVEVIWPDDCIPECTRQPVEVDGLDRVIEVNYAHVREEVAPIE